MAKIIRINARPSRAARSRQVPLNQHGTGIRSQMFFLKPSVTRVPVRIVSCKRQPIHIHQHACTFDGEYVPVSAVIALCKDVPVCCVTNHSNYTLK